mgnify:CR=1 FL=1
MCRLAGLTGVKNKKYYIYEHFYIFEGGNMPIIKFLNRWAWLIALAGLIISIITLTTNNRRINSRISQTPVDKDRAQVDNFIKDIVSAQVNKKKPSKGQLVSRSFYKFPPAVEKTKNENLVAVEFIAARVVEKKVTPLQVRGTGFVVDDNGSIITVMHNMGEVPADWFAPTTFIRVHDDHGFFDVRLEKRDWIVDLAMLKIRDWQSNKSKFRKTPATLATIAEKGKLEGFDHLYAFGFMTSAVGVLHLPIILGPYFQESNISDDEQEVELIMSGSAGNRIDAGFSGGPLLGPDGKIYGIVKQTTNTHTYVVTLENLLAFIQSDQKTINEKLFSAQSSEDK